MNESQNDLTQQQQLAGGQDLSSHGPLRGATTGDGAKETAPIAATESVLTYRMVGDMGPLFAAKAAARLKFNPIEKDREVEVQPKKRDDGSWPAKYKFQYATLGAVRAACDPALAENGLDIFHLPCTGLDDRELHTFLAHSSGAFIEAVLLISNVKGWQEFGSAMTYAERYSYVALAGVAAEHDDDGNAADGNTVQNSQPRDRSKPAPPPKAPPKPPGKPATIPQDAPLAQERPKAPAQPQSAPQPKSEPPPAPTELLATADKLAEMKSLLVALQFKGTPAKELIGLVTGKDHAVINNADVDQVISVLQKAFDSKWDADRLMLLVRETPDPATAIRTIEEETAAMGCA